MSDSTRLKTRTVHIVYAVMAALSLSLGHPGEAHARGDFTKSCKNIALNHSDESSWFNNLGVWVSADCPRFDGGFQYTALNLSEHIGNDNGQIVWNGSGFDRTCGWSSENYLALHIHGELGLPVVPEQPYLVCNGKGCSPTGMFIAFYCRDLNGEDQCRVDSFDDRCRKDLDECVENQNGVLTYICG